MGCGHEKHMRMSCINYNRCIQCQALDIGGNVSPYCIECYESIYKKSTKDAKFRDEYWKPRPNIKTSIKNLLHL